MTLKKIKEKIFEIELGNNGEVFIITRQEFETKNGVIKQKQFIEISQIDFMKEISPIVSILSKSGFDQYAETDVKQIEIKTRKKKIQFFSFEQEKKRYLVNIPANEPNDNYNFYCTKCDDEISCDRRQMREYIIKKGLCYKCK